MAGVAPGPSRISLDGDEWRCRSYLGDEWQSARLGEVARVGQGGWLPASVPGSVVADLLRAGEVPDPYFGLNSRYAEWAADRWWAYQTDFVAPRLAEDERLELVLEGVDYACRVYLDGALLGRHEGMFIPARFDVTERLRGGSRHVIAVLLEPSPPSESQTGDTARVRVHKTRMSYGWDFSPRLVHQGIWQPVGLRRTGPVRIERPFVRTELASDTRSARLVCELELDGRTSGDLEVHVRVGLDDSVAVETSQRIRINASTGLTPVQLSIDLADVQLWWPNGSGGQPLYQVELRILVDGRLSDEVVIQHGVRSLGLEPNIGAPPEARPYRLVVNGRSIYLNGWNWVPIDMLYGVPRPGKLAHLLNLARAAHVNMLRVWGGGLIESSAFYEACDRLGILVWQEFVQSSSGRLNAPARDAEFTARMAREAEQIVPSRRNHASLALWCGGNELMEDGLPLDESAPVLGAIREVVRRLDPEQPFLPSSPSGPVASFVDLGDAPGHDTHGPWEHQGLNRHQAMYNSRQTLLHSEFGAEGMAGLAAIEATIPADRRWPPTRDNAVYAHRGAWWINESLVQQAFGGGLDDLPAVVRASQFLQADGLRYAVEASLRRRWLSSGTLPWQFNEPFPNAWCTSAVDWFGRPKPAYHALAHAYEPVHVSAAFERQVWAGAREFSATVWATSNLPDAVPARLTARCKAADGRDLGGLDVDVTCRALASAELGTVRCGLEREIPGEVFVLDLRLADASDTPLSLNRYLFSVTESLAPLRRLAAGALDATRIEDGPDRWRLSLRNTGKWLLPALTIEDARPATASGWAIPDANHVTLMPGERREFSVAFTDVTPGDRQLLISGWNLAEHRVA